MIQYSINVPVSKYITYVSSEKAWVKIHLNKNFEHHFSITGCAKKNGLSEMILLSTHINLCFG